MRPNDLVWLVENHSDLPDKTKGIRFPADFGSKREIGPIASKPSSTQTVPMYDDTVFHRHKTVTITFNGAMRES